MRKISIITILSCLVLFSCQEKTNAPQGGPRPLPVVEIIQRNVQKYTTFPAEIKGKNNNEVRPKIGGYIQEVYVDEGEEVVAGQLLYKLETNIMTKDAEAAKAQISAAKANVNAAQVEVDKLKPLVEKQIISQVQLETAKATLSQTQAAYQVAIANYKSMEENIKFSTIHSSINGIVGKLNYRKGSLVSPSDQTPLTVISDSKEVYAYFNLNEKQYIDFYQQSKGKNLQEKIANYPEVELELANGSIYEEKGKLEATTGQIDPNTGTILFRATFDNKNGMLNNGNTGKIKVAKTYKNALVIPESATFEQQGFVYVYKLDSTNTVKATMIKLIDRVDNLAIIESGLNKGESVAASGLGSLKDGMSITPQVVGVDQIVLRSQKVM
ncbi:efflux RND transporter periplasmic adaptor subunit [Flammeovirgaceae bacterium SG7u.111]|nr:efflux RND transporter periplasmic adaptor subunit [Flammeovirgaceae bacterium SG7u.132]WPO37517.1 efflux RND transporter periplasmic adaptor subunit [Flammeovirgaceae bacterium SG7u.111]